MRHQLSTTSVPTRGSDWALSPGRRARAAWSSHEEDQRTARVLPEAIRIIEADLEAHIDNNRTLEALAASRRLGNARAALASALARLRVYEGKS